MFENIKITLNSRPCSSLKLFFLELRFSRKLFLSLCKTVSDMLWFRIQSQCFPSFVTFNILLNLCYTYWNLRQCFLPTTTAASGTGPCIDVDANECATKQYLCSNSLYKDLMTKDCPATCGFCAGAGGSATTTVAGKDCLRFFFIRWLNKNLDKWIPDFAS